MKIDPEIRRYLAGELFSDRLAIPITDGIATQDRLTFLGNLFKNQNVIHVGCCDHLPLIQEKRARKEFLHDTLYTNANRCIGIDINAEAIQFLEKLGYKNLYCADLTIDNIPQIRENRWKYILFGEILEHVDNPVQFLKSIKDKYSDYIEFAVITAPNAYSIRNQFRCLFRGEEVINSDHRYWFTPYTLGKVATRAGLYPESIYYCRYHRGTALSGALSRVVMCPSHLRGCIVMITSF